jgi:diacylglycerol kinase family enzyme
MKRLFLVMNPGSRSFQCRFDWQVLLACLRERQVDFDFALTQAPEHARLATQSAALSGFDSVVAVGGDGTINEVMNGLVDPGKPGSRPEIPHAAMGVIYTGTSPDFCRYHGIPLSLEAAIDTLLSSRPKMIDLCRISYRESCSGNAVSRVFGCSANFGLGAAVARGANLGLRRRWGDFSGTFLATLQALHRYHPPDIRIRIDGREAVHPRFFNLFVGKNPFVASGIKIGSGSGTAPDDGRLFCTAISGISRFRALALLPRLYTGSLSRIFPPVYGTRVEIPWSADAPEVEFDGDPHGLLPATIEVLPQALPLIKPN